MKILVADSAPPCDLTQGASLVGWHLFRRLRHHDMTLLTTAPRDRIDDYRQVLSQHFNHVHLVPTDRQLRALPSLLTPALARISGSNGHRDARAVKDYRQALATLLAAEHFDVLHTRQLPTAVVTRSLSHPRQILELIDSHSLYWARRTGWRAPRAALRTAASVVLEACTVRRFAACTTVSEADARVVRALAPRLPVHVVPNGVDADYFSPQPVAEDACSLVFVGAMDFSPNATAVMDFCRRILPLVRRELPDVRLAIVGRDPAPEICALSADRAITVTGFVQDVRPWVARSTVTICPMLAGSGIKNKVLEALAMERAVVTTSLGAEAIEATDGRELRIADGPGSFARAVVELIGDETARRRLGKAGRAMVRRKYTWDAVAAAYEHLYLALAASLESGDARATGTYGAAR